MEEITVVTAFFDIGRAKIKNFERDNDKYISYFKFWARMRNNLIIYTDKKTAEKVLEIRKSFNLQDRTKIIIIDDVYALDSDVYQKIKTALSHEICVNFRKKPQNPESWNPQYNYITFLKPYFVADAVDRGYADGLVAWIDFGFNHAGETCVKAEEFDFLWRYNFANKIHLFALEELDDIPIFEIVRTMKAYIAGAVMVAPAQLWAKLADSYKEAAITLAQCGFADDDQTLAIMAYRKNPQIFEIHKVDDFFSALIDVGGGHLTRREKIKYKETKKEAQKLWASGRYVRATQVYLKYAQEKWQR